MFKRRKMYIRFTKNERTFFKKQPNVRYTYTKSERTDVTYS